jgi:hypothetical protein
MEHHHLPATLGAWRIGAAYAMDAVSGTAQGADWRSQPLSVGKPPTRRAG